jgi:hypothetical protein
MPTPRSPKIFCWHLWADDAGRTHQTLCKLAAFEWQGMGGGTRVEMGPGDLAFGGNRMARPDGQGRVGHRSERSERSRAGR